VTLNSDDPGMFSTTLCGEYQLAYDVFGVDVGGLADLARAAVRASFRDDAGKRGLLAEIDGYEASYATSGDGPENRAQPRPP
jgi:aminodeoxyfutalosine deaminase